MKKELTKEEVQHLAYQTYAAIGELSIKRKQSVQHLSLLDEKLQALEQQIIDLSKAEVE